MSFKLFLWIFLLGVLLHIVSASTLKNKVFKRDVNGIIEFDIDEDEKAQIQTLHGVPNNKKQGIIESILNKLGASKYRPHISFHNPLKKPIEEIQEYLKPKPAPTVTRTKVIKLETTRVITKHPICVASVHLKPACSALNNQPIAYRDNSEQVSREDVVDKVEKLLSEIEIKPSAVINYSDDLSTIVYDSEPDARTGRFLSVNEKTPSIDNVKSVINEQSIEEEDDIDEGRFLFKNGPTKYVTKTIWATKVQTITDYKVTATLVPENCVPLDLYFPQCPNTPAIHSKPSLWKEENGHN